ncbi:MAG TPA: alpha/beta fold hydrolase [Terriglobales bacterium]|nr:alpha/beta fold hydrolase [Terriglobales bacterium]
MRRTKIRRKSRISPIRTREYKKADLPILGEALFAAELVLLHAAPLYYGLGIPHGNNSAVVLLPAFLCPDAYLAPLHNWLARIGYEPFFSGIGFNTECPNLLIRRQLNETIEKALAKSGCRVHLIGHSLGGIIARAIAAQRPADVASVITLGAPFRGTVAHSSILHAAKLVRRRILAKHGSDVLPECYTGHCTCDFLESLRHSMPGTVSETAIYSEGDGVVDWRYCKTDRPEADFSVSGTHIGLVYNASVYAIIAERLARTFSEAT